MRTGAQPVALPNGNSFGRSDGSISSPLSCRINPDRGIDNISPFYFTVMGTCLSFVLVFKSNIAYNRHRTALEHTPDYQTPEVCCSHV